VRIFALRSDRTAGPPYAFRERLRRASVGLCSLVAAGLKDGARVFTVSSAFGRA